VVNSYPDGESYNELEALLPDLLESELPEAKDYFRGTAARRRKAAVVLIMVWGGTIALHFLTWGAFLVWCMTTILGVQALRLFLTRPLSVPRAAEAGDLPFISLVVAAKNEEAVIETLVCSLCSLDYPDQRYEVWVVDDHSTDQTPILLNQLAQEYPQLRVLRRGLGAGGGKSGALNQVRSCCRGEIIGVFDADAQVPADVLRQVVPLFHQARVGAVQLRKAIANAPLNFWTWGQATEMALDAYIHRQRVAIGGIGELRGNGQFVRRLALVHCGGWSEETITDDLDLALRLHLDQWQIQVLYFPAVLEEGVTSFRALWHQRNRWAEGGYQRYLDYWRFVVNNPMGLNKTFDLFSFWLLQYILPTAAIPDLVLAIARSRLPLLTPLSTLTLTLSLVGMVLGLRTLETQKNLVDDTPDASDSQPIWEHRPSLVWLQTCQGLLYMMHWFVVIPSVTLRMALRPKRLKWIKTTHYGRTGV